MTDPLPPDPSGVLDADLVWGHHVLLVGAQVTPADVEALACSRFRGASRRDDHTIDLLPGAWLTGPWELDDRARRRLEVPDQAVGAYVARAPVHRAGPVPEELQGLGGLLDAFADGTPEGIESEVVEFLFAAARRLGGAMRVGGSGYLLVPDPGDFVDLTVLAPVWLEPEALTVVLGPVLPGIDVLPRPVIGPLPRTPELEETWDEQEHAALHARAQAFDDQALAAADAVESYGAIWRFEDGGLLSIQVEALEQVPAVLDEDDAEGLLAYAVRWYPERDEQSGEPVGSTAPERARALIEGAARALRAAAGGVIVDDDGFLVEV